MRYVARYEHSKLPCNVRVSIAWIRTLVTGEWIPVTVAGIRVEVKRID